MLTTIFGIVSQFPYSEIYLGIHCLERERFIVEPVLMMMNLEMSKFTMILKVVNVLFKKIIEHAE